MFQKIMLFLVLVPMTSFAFSLKSLNSQKAPFELPKLAYPTDALVPVIDQQTMEIHHGRHHKAFTDNLNAALDDQMKKASLLEILQNVSKHPTAVRNNAGGYWNHSFFWGHLRAESRPTKMSEDLEKAIVSSFGSVDEFKAEFEKQATRLFGSGWVWLIKAEDGKLKVVSTPNQDNPLMDVSPERGMPILSLDVWEHAYYLAYQNKRADYVKNFWRVVNWEQVARNFRGR